MIKKIIKRLLSQLAHHPEHYIEATIFGEHYKLCSRCTGRYIAEAISFFIGMFVYFFTDLTFDFTAIFLLSWVLAGLTLLDWSSVELFHLRKGSNKIRFITGATLGISISIYFWLLPATWFFKLVTLAVYFFVFGVISISIKLKKNHINPLDEFKKGIDNIWDILLHPSKLWIGCYCVPCCSTECCCGGSSCCTSSLCLLSCCLPCLCCPVCSGGLSGSTCGGKGKSSCSSCGSCGGVNGKK